MKLIEYISGYHLDTILQNHHLFEYSEDEGLTWKFVRRDNFLFRALRGGLIVREIVKEYK